MRSLRISLIGVVAAVAHSALATDISGNSSSFAFFTNLTASSYSFTNSPTPSASGSAPGPYSHSSDLGSYAFGTNGNASITTTTLDATVGSTVDGTAGSKSTTASAYADGVSFEIGGNIVVFSANVVATNALGVSGDFGSLSTNGYADFSGASLTVFGNPYYFSTVPDANTVMYASGGLVITSNLQKVTGDGISSRGISITALDMKFTNFTYGSEVLNGEVMFSHADATMTAAPEPATLTGLCVFALAGARGIASRRRLHGRGANPAT